MKFIRRREFELWSMNKKYLLIEFETQLKAPHDLTVLDWKGVKSVVKKIVIDRIKKHDEHEFSIVLESSLLLQIKTDTIDENLMKVMGLTDGKNKYEFYVRVVVERQQPQNVGIITVTRSANNYDISLDDYDPSLVKNNNENDTEKMETNGNEPEVTIEKEETINTDEYVPTSQMQQSTLDRYIPRLRRGFTKNCITPVEPYQPQAATKDCPVVIEKYVPDSSTSTSTQHNEYTPKRVAAVSTDQETSSKPMNFKTYSPVKLNPVKSKELFGDDDDEDTQNGDVKLTEAPNAEDDQYEYLMNKYKDLPLKSGRKGSRTMLPKLKPAKPEKPSTSGAAAKEKSQTWLKRGGGKSRTGVVEKRKRPEPKKQETPEKIRRLREEAEEWSKKNTELKKVNEVLEAAFKPRKKKNYTNHQKKMLPDYPVERLRELYEAHFKDACVEQFNEYLKNHRQCTPHPHMYTIQSLASITMISLVMDLLQEKLGKAADMGLHTVLFSEQLAPYLVMELYKLEFNLTEEEANEQANWQAEPSIESEDEFDLNDDADA